MKRIFLLVLSGLVMAAAHSQNEAREVKTTYTVSGGLLGAANFSKFRTNNNSTGVDYSTKTGWSAGAWVNIPVTSGFSVEPQLMYSSYRYFTSNTTTLLLNDGEINYVSLPILLKFNAGDKFAITAGPQFDFLSSVDDKNNTAVKDDFKKTSFALSGGLELFPHGRVTVFGRYIFGLTNMDNRANHPTTVEYKNQLVQAGLKIRLFGSKNTTVYRAAEVTVPTPPLDTDGDGIPDNVDKCPNVAGIARYDGCPIPDTDGDGINDELDKCPTVAGLAKYDGCPIPDTDGDGINDEQDKCPTVAGLAKYDGCPAPDRDHDGINDDEDKCPDIAGVASNHGCPEVPANVSKSLDVEAHHIAFGPKNSTTITVSSNASMDNVVRMMNENPGLSIRVEGHTDNVGDDDANMQLSKDRAEAVKAYMVSKGISADRITAEGFGETQPIADNKTAAGRAKNKRIEIRIAY